jgi:steroid 5-alpha reductase family enzyme
MWKTALLLIVTIIIVPFLAFRIDTPLNPEQQAILAELFWIYVIAAALCFITSTITANYSQVDKLWSIMPVIYAWIICIRSGYEPRLVLMAVVVSIWGIRLTYNFARRGGYSLKIWTGEQDYRWPVLRKKPEFAAQWKWTLFNLLFISFYQMGLILLITLPALKSLGARPLSWVDYLIAFIAIIFVVTETIADQQQWNFQKEKQGLLEEGKPLPEKYRKGFVDSGLWGIVRHPNYASEQSIWIVFYFFSVSATGLWLNWSVIGAILLILLFYGSSSFSESISMSKYPGYSEYQVQTPRFIPLKTRK